MAIYEQQIQAVWEVADVNLIFIRLQKNPIINKAETYASALLTILASEAFTSKELQIWDFFLLFLLQIKIRFIIFPSRNRCYKQVIALKELLFDFSSNLKFKTACHIFVIGKLFLTLLGSVSTILFFYRI